MARQYTDEKNTQVLIALLKAHGIRKVVASPGTTNVTLVASLQGDPYFEMYSSVDERSAAYIACGLSAESHEPVVLSCTGATASRNYLSGLTEAYYRKLPILAVTSTQAVSKVGHHIAQIIDRSSLPKDVARLSVTLPIVKDDDDLWDCELKVNKAILELTHHGGGPVHINNPTTYTHSFGTKELPSVRVIDRVTATGRIPELPPGRVAVFVGAHSVMSPEETEAVDRFCSSRDAVVFCDHTSNYRGKYRVLFSLVACQEMYDLASVRPDILIHIGEVSGDYYSLMVSAREVWRVSEDGELRDTFRRLRYVFEMPERVFFERYTADGTRDASYRDLCAGKLAQMAKRIPELPFSNVWVASRMAHRIPRDARIHLGILNSLRSWNFFELPPSVSSASNVGGFGIDGGLSSLVGASLADRKRLCFGVVGDLSFFYDMNVLGNRHIGKNLRILLVNNGKGTEFRLDGNLAAQFGDEADVYTSAAGHFGNKSRVLVRHYAEDLGFEYLSAGNKDEFERACERFLTDEITDRPMLFELFTESSDECIALDRMRGIEENPRGIVKKIARQVLGENTRNAIKKVMGK